MYIYIFIHVAMYVQKCLHICIRKCVKVDLYTHIGIQASILQAPIL